LFGSVKKGVVWFGYYSYYTAHVIANITATVDDMTLTSLTSIITTTTSK